MGGFCHPSSHQAVLHPLLFSLSAQPVFSDLLQLSRALAEHLEGSSLSCVCVCEDIGRGLCDGNGVHGGCERASGLIRGEAVK